MLRCILLPHFCSHCLPKEAAPSTSARRVGALAGRFGEFYLFRDAGTIRARLAIAVPRQERKTEGGKYTPQANNRPQKAGNPLNPSSSFLSASKGERKHQLLPLLGIQRKEWKNEKEDRTRVCVCV